MRNHLKEELVSLSLCVLAQGTPQLAMNKEWHVPGIKLECKFNKEQVKRRAEVFKWPD